MESEPVIPPTFFVFLLQLLLDSKKMLASRRIRRSMNSASNSYLSIEEVRREIYKEYTFLSYFVLNDTLCRPLLLNCLSLSDDIFK